MLSIFKKIGAMFVAYVKRLLQIPVYLVHLSYNVIVTWAIMMPLATLTEFIMRHLGYNMTPPIVSEDPLMSLGPLGIAGAMFLVGIWEETFFRYLVMDCWFVKFMRMPMWLAVGLSAVLFGYGHMANLGWPYSFPQVIAAGAAGIWFARVYLKQGLHMSILTHALYNFTVAMASLYLF